MNYAVFSRLNKSWSWQILYYAETLEEIFSKLQHYTPAGHHLCYFKLTELNNPLCQ